ncbi:alpha/beta fold hydrolase [Actinokineospora sp. HBU206404]|uniref:Alpha/beta fold hydrolase n=2 Tax=Actinokineospora xionganensis TaxID=2684470 RepID=A0ABR7LCW3_9PSEU|nr:alpha/beta fold hydrolase [Actinokineospora xionganensis]
MVVAALSSCSAQVSGNPVAGDSETLGPKGPVPAGLDRFYGQTLTWRACRPLAHDDESKRTFGDEGVRCALLSVPLDYAKPDGRTITIGLLRKQATGAKVGSLVINPGGPGVSGMTAAASIAERIADTELAEKFDLVGFDPRGIGVSEPRIRCLTDSEMDKDRVEPDNTTVAEEETENKEFAGKCAERSGGAEVLANVGTRDVARDMDVLRSALGDEKLTYVGYSYGTRIGTAYAEAFPGNVRALVLDGAVDPLEDPVSQAIGQITGFDKALDAYLAWCGPKQSCVVKDETRLRELLETLKKQPLAVGDRQLSASDATTGVAAALYSDETWSFLSAALSALAKGDGSQLLLLADLYLGRDTDGSYTSTMAALVAVRCVDEPRITDRAQVEDATRRIIEGTKDSFMSATDPPLPALDSCAFWPVPNTSEPHQPKVEGLPPTLVISTTGDPATPYTAGVNLAKAIGGRLLTYEATQHTVFMQGDKCVDDAGTRYLVDLTLPADGLRCKG